MKITSVVESTNNLEKGESTRRSIRKVACYWLRNGNWPNPKYWIIIFVLLVNENWLIIDYSLKFCSFFRVIARKFRLTCYFFVAVTGNWLIIALITIHYIECLELFEKSKEIDQHASLVESIRNYSITVTLKNSAHIPICLIVFVGESDTRSIFISIAKIITSCWRVQIDIQRVIANNAISLIVAENRLSAELFAKGITQVKELPEDQLFTEQDTEKQMGNSRVCV